jgi:enediyne biosynthesis protein E4
MLRGVVLLAVALLAACVGKSASQPRPRHSARAAPLEVPRFVDVSAQSGLDALQGTRRLRPRCLLGGPVFERLFPSAPVVAAGHESNDQCIPERMSGGAAVGDVDGDGWADLYLTRLDGPGTLYRNSHDGTFEDVTKRAGLDRVDQPTNGAAWVDVDNDGHLDLFVTTLAGTRFSLFHNDGHGHFVDQAVARGVSLASRDPHVGFSVNVGDYDGDGWLDIETTEWRSPELAGNLVRSHNRLFHNRGRAAPGYFDDVTDSAGVAVEQRNAPALGFASALSDLDGDNRPDLFFVGDYKTSRLFWNDGDGTFTDATAASGFNTAENAMGLAIGDYNRDGRPDVFVTSIFDATPACRHYACGHGNTGNRLYRNDGRRRFTDVTSKAGVRDGGWGWGTAFFDAANAGRLDLVMTSGVAFPWDVSAPRFGAGPMHLWLNRGDGTFADATSSAGLTVAGPGKGLVVFDYNNDGKLDLLVVRDGDTPVLYRNATRSDNAWLGVRAVGTTSNRGGLGAVVTVVAGKTRQTVVVDSTTHFLGQSDPTAHFGFGRFGATVDVRVSWPATGRTSVVSNVSTGRVITVTEPRG